MKNKLKAIWNIITNKPVMMNVTMYIFENELPRISERLFHPENNDGIIHNNNFNTFPKR